VDCTRCHTEIRPGERAVYLDGRFYNPLHAACREEVEAELRAQREKEMTDVADAAREKCCPFAPGHPIACEDESRCIATDCMAWDGCDCRRLQISEVE
jgi:hypothetical protein